jgi:Holliday junction DNA helicase RuvA
MIAFLTGRLAFKAPTHLTLDVQGVGYEVHIPLSTYYALPNLDEVAALNIHTHLREDAIQLFGFLSQSEKEPLPLTTVSGLPETRARCLVWASTASSSAPFNPRMLRSSP